MNGGLMDSPFFFFTFSRELVRTFAPGFPEGTKSSRLSWEFSLRAFGNSKRSCVSWNLAHATSRARAHEGSSMICA